MLVHRFWDNHSYLISNLKGKYGLEAGDEIRLGAGYFGGHATVRVDSIDAAGDKAVLQIEYEFVPIPFLVPQPFPRRFRPPEMSHGFVIGGKFTPVAPRSPIFDLLKEIAAYAVSDDILDITTRTLVRRVALERLMARTEQQHAALDPIRVPASRELEERQNFER